MRKVAVMMAFLSVSCVKNLSKEDMKRILHERNQALGECFKSGDAGKLALMYTDSAKLCANGEKEIYVGRAAIEAFWKKGMEDTELLEMTTETLTIDGNEDVLYETGKTTTKTLYKDSVYLFEVKFANVWKHQPNGKYLLDVDIWNSVSR
jgi:ketosteroid isomerase-like protein